jgi:hypothetical protein
LLGQQRELTMASRNPDAEKEDRPRRRDGDDKEEFVGEPQTPSEADDSDDEFDDSDDTEIDDDTETGSDDGSNP